MSVSITTDQLERSILIAVETVSLGGKELENNTENFGHCTLGLVRLVRF